MRRIAVIGPLADAPAEMLGPWSAAGDPDNPLTVLDGLKAGLPQREILFLAAGSIDGQDIGGIGPACKLAATADVVVLCLGEAAGMSGEAASRANPGLPGRQRELAAAVLETGAPVVAILFSGRPLMTTWLVERAHATLAAWFLGDMAGQAIADVLTGQVNPTGRLPVTWPRDVGQIPIFHAARSSGRPADAANRFTSRYLDLSNEPLFPFGHGLSFSATKLTNLRADRTEFTPTDVIEIQVDAANVGTITTEETVFLFIHDCVARVARPTMELKAWAKVALASEQTKTITFTLTADSFCYLNESFGPVVEPGEFDIMVGVSANREALLSIRVRVCS